MSTTENKSKNGLIRIWDALFYSLAGVRTAFREDKAFRLEIYLALVLFPIAFMLPISLIRKMFLIESMVLVLIMELVNVGIETIVDYISEDYHVLAKKAKDVGSAFVFLALLNCGAMWTWALLGL